jgi:hypothetical protein
VRCWRMLASLIASELVTNALLHSGMAHGVIDFRVVVSPGLIRVEGKTEAEPSDREPLARVLKAGPDCLAW